MLERMEYAGAEQHPRMASAAKTTAFKRVERRADILRPTIIRHSKWPMWSYLALATFGALLIYKANYAVGIFALCIGLWWFFQEARKMADSDVYLRITDKGIRLQKADLIKWEEIEAIAVRKEQQNRKVTYFLLLDGPQLYQKIPLANLSHHPLRIERIISAYYHY